MRRGCLASLLILVLSPVVLTHPACAEKRSSITGKKRGLPRHGSPSTSAPAADHPAEAALDTQAPAPATSAPHRQIDVQAQTEWQPCFEEGSKALVSHRPEGGIQLLRKSAGHGHVRSIVLLGNIYWRSDYTKPDHAEALRWFQMAADLGSIDGLFGIGNIMRESSTPESRERARQTYKQILQVAPEGSADQARARTTLYEIEHPGEEIPSSTPAPPTVHSSIWPVGTTFTGGNKEGYKLIGFDAATGEYTFLRRKPRLNAYGFYVEQFTAGRYSAIPLMTPGGDPFCENCGGSGYVWTGGDLRWGTGSPDGNSSNGVIGWSTGSKERREEYCTVCGADGI